jgi:inosose dehydratase
MTASVSLDRNPIALKRLFEKHGITPSTVCAHAKLLNPSNPSKYGVNEIWRAVKLAAQMRVPNVITTEMEPDTAWGKSLSVDEGALIIAEKIHDAVELA